MSTQISDAACIVRRAQYYETDSMRIVHHSNYVKWMEEARLHYFDLCGFSWSAMERETGIMIPVLFQSVEYKRAIRFGEPVRIECACTKFNGVKMNFDYLFKSAETGEVKALGITRHAFIGRDYRPIALQNGYKAGYDALAAAYPAPGGAAARARAPGAPAEPPPQKRQSPEI